MIEPTFTHYAMAFTIPIVLALFPEKDDGKIFSAGLIVSMGLQMCMQDIKGKEAYLKMMDEHWVNFSPIVGIIIIFFGAYVYFKASARVKKRFKSLYHIAPIKVTPNKK